MLKFKKRGAHSARIDPLSREHFTFKKVRKKAVGAARRDRAEGRTWDVPALLLCVFTLRAAALFSSFGSKSDRYKATYPEL